MIITLENGKQIIGSEIITAILRSSLEPIPMTFECTIKLHESFAAHLLENKILKVGTYQTPVRIVFAEDNVANWTQGSVVVLRKIIALHENSAGIAMGLQKAVIRENVSLSEVYRSCGGKSEVGKDFTVPRFYAYKGNTPSQLIARVCQEHGGVVRWLPKQNALAFTRINDLFGQKPQAINPRHADNSIKSLFLTDHEVAQYISIAKDGAILQGQVSNQSARQKVIFTPHKTQAQLNSMNNVLLQARKIPCEYAPNIHAGELVTLDKYKMVILTAAHSHFMNDTGAHINESVFWLGVRTKQIS